MHFGVMRQRCPERYQTCIPFDKVEYSPMTSASEEKRLEHEHYHLERYKKMTGINLDFVQDNHSRSRKGTLRGLHYQLDPYSQGKLVRCINGNIYDVAVDLRKDSETFGTSYQIPSGKTQGTRSKESFG